MSTTLGRTLGSNFVLISGLIYYEDINIITYSFCTVLFVFLIVLTFIFYTELRVKAIARIINKKGLNVYKKEDF